MIREKLEQYYSFVFEKELLDEIEQVGVFKKLRENELLVDLGDQMKGVPLLLDGAIKIVREDKKGEEILLYFLEKRAFQISIESFLYSAQYTFFIFVVLKMMRLCSEPLVKEVIHW